MSQLNTVCDAFDEREKRPGPLFKDNALWVPPTVTSAWLTVEGLESRDCPVKASNGVAGVLMLTYPLPQGWRLMTPSTAVWEAGLPQGGWTRRVDTTGVLQDFVRLADVDVTKKKGLKTSKPLRNSGDRSGSAEVLCITIPGFIAAIGVLNAS